MNRVETWQVEEMEDIEESVNTYCNRYNLNPISISVSYDARRCYWCVAVIVEQQENDND